MAKNQSYIFVLSHIHFKKRFAKGDTQKIFESMKKYTKTRSKKSIIKNTDDDNLEIRINLSNANLRIGLTSNEVHTMIRCVDQHKALSDLDKILNSMAIFLNTSESKVGQIMTSFSKTYPIKKDPMMKFVDRDIITEFSTQVKKSFKPRAIHLTTGVEKISGDEEEFSVMISHDEDELELEMTIETRLYETIPLDMLVKNNKTINGYKNKVFTGLGVQEK